MKYAFFSFLAVLINLLFQHLTLSFYNDFLSLYLAMFVGTFFGLITKYYLDKKFIFQFKTINKRKDIATFLKYSLTGVATTLIFWGFEISFHAIFKGESAKYIGAIIGLSIGYLAKYYLDKKIVFN